ncbi:hypothetical protein [Limnovirga soli]|uniref:Lipocalin-like domain-containing protein n=1 Tax=Limnovirga soli TaxID=2656915 RepID=A0A8J8FBR6_9BACT|nr:hypothetical protein [Limnovirga soli]NNV55080.1 hypothetical protein [Limnovirga soli]
MKVILLDIVLLLSLSCNSQAMKEHIFIIGIWSLINIDGLSCNVCPEIKFTKDGKGKITKPSREEIDFTYTLSLENKKIVFSIDANQQYFNEKEYSYKVYTEDNLEILELSLKDKPSKYILTRKK